METQNIFPTHMEVWVPIKDHPSYEASSEGRIRSLPKRTRSGTRILKQNIGSGTGYLYISMVKDGKSNNYTAHRLICECFHGPSMGRHTNHKNGIKTDNRAVNLEWSTVSENRLHAFRTGLQSARGDHNSQAKLTAEQVLEIRNHKGRKMDMVEKFGISAPTVCDIQKRRSWTHI